MLQYKKIQETFYNTRKIKSKKKNYNTRKIFTIQENTRQMLQHKKN